MRPKKKQERSRPATESQGGSKKWTIWPWLRILFRRRLEIGDWAELDHQGRQSWRAAFGGRLGWRPGKTALDFMDRRSIRYRELDHLGGGGPESAPLTACQELGVARAAVQVGIFLPTRRTT